MRNQTIESQSYLLNIRKSEMVAALHVDSVSTTMRLSQNEDDTLAAIFHECGPINTISRDSLIRKGLVCWWDTSLGCAVTDAGYFQLHGHARAQQQGQVNV